MTSAKFFMRSSLKDETDDSDDEQQHEATDDVMQGLLRFFVHDELARKSVDGTGKYTHEDLPVENMWTTPKKGISRPFPSGKRA
jgi:hypothetical protein